MLKPMCKKIIVIRNFPTFLKLGPGALLNLDKKEIGKFGAV